MNSIEIKDSELTDIPLLGVPAEQQYYLFLKNKGVPFDGVVWLTPRKGFTYHTERCTSEMVTKISWEDNANN